MIRKLIKFENIGTPKYLFELSNLINNGTYKRNEINDFFTGRSIDGITIFDGGLSTLEYVGIVELSKKGVANVPGIQQHFLKDSELLKNRIITTFIERWMKDPTFDIIFNQSTLFFDASLSIAIYKSSFRFGKYSKLKQFLIDFNVLSDSYMNDCFSINPKYRKYFDKSIVLNFKERVLSLDEFEKIQNLKNTYGEAAEVFVLELEREKFKNHILSIGIEQISKIDAGAGYDISSLQSDKSTTIDKFIEVKSYSESPYFYWSRNEVRVAEIEKNNYFLYLVNRDEMNNIDYSPIIIQNPFENVFDNEEWGKEPQSWKFELKDNA